MKESSSIDCYRKYFNLNNGNIRVMLTGGTTIRGQIVGFLRTESDNNSEITKWHLVTSSSPTLLGTDAFGMSLGVFIAHKDIFSIFFEEDGSTMVFKPPSP